VKVAAKKVVVLHVVKSAKKLIQKLKKTNAKVIKAITSKAEAKHPVKKLKHD